MATRIQYRRGTAAAWAAANPVLADGEPGRERDTGKMKVGDGVTAWVNLPYDTGGGSGSATLTQLTTKGDLAVGVGGGAITRQPVGADGTVLRANGSSGSGIEWAPLPDAAAGSKGVVALTGDLGGTAAAPTVPALAGKYVKPGTGIPKTDLATAVQTSLTAADAALPAAQRNVPNGVAPLGADGKVPAANLPTAAGAFPLGSANNPVKDANAARPNLGAGIAVWWDTATEPVNWIDGDYQLDAG